MLHECQLDESVENKVDPLCYVVVFQSKKKFERECREAEKSQITFDRLDNDINATKSEVEKVSAVPLNSLRLWVRIGH